MAQQIAISGIHHLALVVTNLQRSSQFYTDLLGFKPLVDLGERIIFGNGNTLLALTLPAGPGAPPPNDRFDENRVGLDHVSLTVQSRANLEEAVRILDERGIDHGEIKDLGEGLKLYVLAFRDPDNIQLELTAPYA